jgi:DNA-binding transcriptional ArsR family regulator
VQAAIDAIAEPRRREILHLVRDHEMAAGRIAAQFDVTRQAVSQHLRVLHDAGLVSERRDGTRRIYRARPDGLLELRNFLDEFWDDRLDALKREVEAEQENGDAGEGARR